MNEWTVQASSRRPQAHRLGDARSSQPYPWSTTLLPPLPDSPHAPRLPLRHSPTHGEQLYEYPLNRRRRPQQTHHRTLLPWNSVIVTNTRAQRGHNLLNKSLE
jgi:hypothetical protein